MHSLAARRRTARTGQKVCKAQSQTRAGAHANSAVVLAAFGAPARVAAGLRAATAVPCCGCCRCGGGRLVVQRRAQHCAAAHYRQNELFAVQRIRILWWEQTSAKGSGEVERPEVWFTNLVSLHSAVIKNTTSDVT